MGSFRDRFTGSEARWKRELRGSSGLRNDAPVTTVSPYGLARSDGFAPSLIRARLLLGVFLMFATGACDGTNTGRCQHIAPRDQPDDRTVVIGTLRPGPEPIDERFMPWTDASAQPLIFGFQGGWMLRPTVRVSALPDDPEGLCATIDLRNESAVPVEDGVQLSRELVRVGDWHYLGPLNDLLGFDDGPLLGQDVTLEATVTSERFSSGETVTVTLTAPE